MSSATTKETSLRGVETDSFGWPLDPEILERFIESPPPIKNKRSRKKNQKNVEVDYLKLKPMFVECAQCESDFFGKEWEFRSNGWGPIERSFDGDRLFSLCPKCNQEFSK